MFYSFLCVPADVMMSETMKIRLKKIRTNWSLEGIQILLFSAFSFIRLILVHAIFTTCIMWLSVPAVF